MTQRAERTPLLPGWGYRDIRDEVADRLAGKLKFDATPAGGATIDVEFDAPLLKSFTKAR